MKYKLGDWKTSTLNALDKLKKENDKQHKPTSSFFHNGAIAQWLVLLKQDGYVTKDGSGHEITEKGLQLLNSLKENPPDKRRKKRKNRQKIFHKKGMASVDVPDNSFTLDVTSNANDDFYITLDFEADKSKIFRAIAAFQEELQK